MVQTWFPDYVASEQLSRSQAQRYKIATKIYVLIIARVVLLLGAQCGGRELEIEIEVKETVVAIAAVEEAVEESAAIFAVTARVSGDVTTA